MRPESCVSGRCNHALHGTGLAGNTASPVHRLDPRAKVIGFLGLTLVAVTTPLDAWPVFVACALVLAAVSAVARIGPTTTWRRVRFVLPLVLCVALFLPFVRGGDQLEVGPLALSVAGLAAFAAVSVKAVLGTTSAVLLGATTTFPATLRALESLRVPRLLVLIAGFVYRYLHVVVDEVQRMRAALTARGYQPRTALGAGAVGRVATALFLRTHARGERVYLAMLSRGYRGSVPALDTLRFGATDAVFVGAVALTLLPLRLLLALP
jgi:cobalt/nickel transport system permease protein